MYEIYHNKSCYIKSNKVFLQKLNTFSLFKNFQQKYKKRKLIKKIKIQKKINYINKKLQKLIVIYLCVLIVHNCTI